MGKFDSSQNEYTKTLAHLAEDPLAFCDEVQCSTDGAVHHNKRQPTPELFSEPVSTQPQASHHSAKRKRIVPLEEPALEEPAPEEEIAGPSKKQKTASEDEDSEELQTHFIGK